jgi:xanthine dehydrogenase YagR molybdenum-binding subunit
MAPFGAFAARFVEVPVDRDLGRVRVARVGEVGLVGIVGMAAAIANAVFHATGRRIRSLPITIDRLL